MFEWPLPTGFLSLSASDREQSHRLWILVAQLPIHTVQVTSSLCQAPHHRAQRLNCKPFRDLPSERSAFRDPLLYARPYSREPFTILKIDRSICGTPRHTRFTLDPPTAMTCTRIRSHTNQQVDGVLTLAHPIWTNTRFRCLPLSNHPNNTHANAIARLYAVR